MHVLLPTAAFAQSLCRCVCCVFDVSDLLTPLPHSIRSTFLSCECEGKEEGSKWRRRGKEEREEEEEESLCVIVDSGESV